MQVLRARDVSPHADRAAARSSGGGYDPGGVVRVHDVVDDHVHAFRGSGQHDRLADAGIAAGDHDGLGVPHHPGLPGDRAAHDRTAGRVHRPAAGDETAMRLARQGVHQARYQLAQPAPPCPARRRLRPSCRGQGRGPRCRRSRYHGPFGRIRTFTRTDRSRLSYGAKCFLSALSLTAPAGLPLKVAALMIWTVGMTVTLNSCRAFRPVTSAHPALRIPQRRGLRGGPRTRRAFRCAVYQGKETEDAD